MLDGEKFCLQGIIIYTHQLTVYEFSHQSILCFKIHVTSCSLFILIAFFHFIYYYCSNSNAAAQLLLQSSVDHFLLLIKHIKFHV